MADTVVIKEFVAVMGYRVDESAQRRFVDGIEAMTAKVLGFSAALSAAATAAIAGMFKMADAGEQMKYLAQAVGDSVTNIDAYVFALSKQGLAADQTVSSVKRLTDAMRTDPQVRSIWAHYTGEQQVNLASLEALQRRLVESARTNPSEHLAMLMQLTPLLGADFLRALERGAIQPGVAEYKGILARYGFSPDQFAKDSVAFENTWRDFHARLNAVAGHAYDNLEKSFTKVFQHMSDWLDQHAPEINEKVDALTTNIDTFTRGMTSLMEAFLKLTPAQKDTILALFAGIAFYLFPTASALAGVAILIEKLIVDYQKFQDTKSRTGKGESDLGLNWDVIGTGLGHTLDTINEIAQALGGWTTILETIATIYVGRKLFLAFSHVFDKVRGIKDTLTDINNAKVTTPSGPGGAAPVPTPTPGARPVPAVPFASGTTTFGGPVSGIGVGIAFDYIQKYRQQHPEVVVAEKKAAEEIDNWLSEKAKRFTGWLETVTGRVDRAREGVTPTSPAGIPPRGPIFGPQQTTEVPGLVPEPQAKPDLTLPIPPIPPRAAELPIPPIPPVQPPPAAPAPAVEPHPLQRVLDDYRRSGEEARRNLGREIGPKPEATLPPVQPPVPEAPRNLERELGPKPPEVSRPPVQPAPSAAEAAHTPAPSPEFSALKAIGDYFHRSAEQAQRNLDKEIGPLPPRAPTPAAPAASTAPPQQPALPQQPEQAPGLVDRLHRWLGREQHSVLDQSNAQRAAYHSEPERPAETGMFSKLYQFLSYLNPISAARAEELPINIKNLDQSVKSLDQGLRDWLEYLASEDLTRPGGAGGGAPGQPGGGDREHNPLAAMGIPGAPGPRKYDVNDPKFKEYFSYLTKDKGVSTDDATALIATAFSESSGNPRAVNPSSGAFGLFQWLGSRQNDLADYAKSNKLDPREWRTQLDFALHEMTKGHEQAAGLALRSANSVNDKIKSLIWDFERPGVAGSLGDYRRAAPFARDFAASMQRSDVVYASNNTTNNNSTANTNAPSSTITINVTGASDPQATARELEYSLNRWGDHLRRWNTMVQ